MCAFMVKYFRLSIVAALRNLKIKSKIKQLNHNAIHVLQHNFLSCFT